MFFSIDAVNITIITVYVQNFTQNDLWKARFSWLWLLGSAWKGDIRVTLKPSIGGYALQNAGS